MRPRRLFAFTPLGPYSVGVRTSDLVNLRPVDILKLDPKTGQATIAH